MRLLGQIRILENRLCRRYDAALLTFENNCLVKPIFWRRRLKTHGHAASGARRKLISANHKNAHDPSLIRGMERSSLQI
jgi:hypothetical protein